MSEFDIEPIPDALAERDQWVCWTEQHRNGEATKIPKHPDGSGKNAKSNDNTTWGSLDQAASTAHKQGWGIGFVFSAADPFVGIDLDDCVDEKGSIKDWLPNPDPFVGDAYIERSPSGNGVHIIAKGVDVPEWWKNQHGEDAREVAVFEDTRFFTFTGQRNNASGEFDTIGSIKEWLLDCWQVFNDDLPRIHTDSSSENDDVDVAVYDILSRSNHPEGERREHPIHGSETGTNFMVDDGAETWRCWRHGVTGNAMHLIGMEAGIIDCGDWDHRDITSDEWADIFDAGRERGYVEESDRPKSQQPRSAAEEARSGTETEDEYSATLKEKIRSRVILPLDPPDDWEGEEIDMKVARHRVAKLLMKEYDFVKPRGDVRGWRETLYVYVDEEGIYEPHGEAFVNEEIERLLASVVDNTTTKEIIGKIERSCLARPGELETDPHRLVVGNGILNLRNGELTDWTPDEYHRTKIDIDYNPDAECDRIDEFLHEIVADDDVVTIYRLVAHTLYKQYTAEKAAMLVGDGQNGKSVLLSLLERFLGRYNVSHRALHDFAENQYAANDLAGKLANLHPDMGDGKIEDLDTFKKLTGRDTMTADVKFESPIHFENRATLIFAANRMPRMGEDTHALWRRWLMINFPYTFDRHDPDAKDPIPKQKLMAELTQAEELQGLLARGVEEIQRWWDGEPWFPEAPTPEQVRENMKRAGEPVYDFAMTCLREADDTEVKKDAVRKCYREYAKAEGLPTIDKSHFGERLISIKDLDIETGRARESGSREYVYKGVEFTPRGRQVLGLDEPESDDPQAKVQGREREDIIMDIVRDLAEKDDNDMASRGMVIGAASNTMDMRSAENTIQKLFDRGEIYEPQTGEYRPT